jgi:hypothetical protein
MQRQIRFGNEVHSYLVSFLEGRLRDVDSTAANLLG